MPTLMAPSTRKPTQTPRQTPERGTEQRQQQTPEHERASGRTPSPAQSDPSRFTAIVTGEVQGVGYRAFARRFATELGVAGHAENLGDGRVEIVAEGRYGDLVVLLKQLRIGPPHAVVKRVDVEWSSSPPSLAGTPEFRTY